MIAKVAARLGKRKLRGALIHSDQSFHYRHPLYIKLLVDRGVVQSLSRKGNRLEKAPVESFFVHMKDELDLTCCHSLDHAKVEFDRNVHHCNHYSYPWGRKKMALVEYKNHLLA